MDLLKNADLVVRFLLELAALATVGWSGYRISGGTLAKLGLATGLPCVAAVV